MLTVLIMSSYLPDMRAGDNYKIKLTITDSLLIPIDITGYKFWLTLKSAFTDLDVASVLQFTTTVGSNVNDVALSGVCIIDVPAASTKSIAEGNYFYDIQQITPLGDITTVMPPVADYKDRIKVVPEVTIAIV